MQTMTVLLDDRGGLRYRHYRISRHAIVRYQQRISEDCSKLLADLDSAVLFDIGTAGPRLRKHMQRLTVDGGYPLIHGQTLFLIKPDTRAHHIVTVYAIHQELAA